MIKGRRQSQFVLVGIAGLLWASAGCDDATQATEGATESEPTVEETSAATATSFNIHCPTELTATWNQIASNTGTDHITGRMIVFPGDRTPTTTLGCALENPGSAKLTRVLPFAEGQIDANCGAQVTITGQGQQILGVPPFGGWNFKSQRITASHVVDHVAHTCTLTVPLGPTDVFVKTTQACKQNSPTNYSCPNGTLPR